MASSRSLSSKSKRRTHHTREGSTTPLVKSKREDHKLSKSKEYDMKIREQNRRSQKSIIKSAQRILYSSRSHKNHENSGMKSQDAQSTVQAQSVSSFVQTKTENDKNSPFKSTFEANHNFDHHEGKDPKGAIRVKPEGSLCAHRKGYKPTPADLECTFKPSINKQSRFLDEKKFRGGVSPTAAVPRYDNLLNKVQS
jgi:hypothetical protein